MDAKVDIFKGGFHEEVWYDMYSQSWKKQIVGNQEHEDQSWEEDYEREGM